MKTLMTPLDAARWLRQRVTGELRTDSRLVQPGDAFIAWPGAATDGRLYLASALRQGAHACILALEGSEPWQALSEHDQAQCFAARHGGEVWAESAGPSGASFFMTLPQGAPRAP